MKYFFAKGMMQIQILEEQNGVCLIVWEKMRMEIIK